MLILRNRCTYDAILLQILPLFLPKLMVKSFKFIGFTFGIITTAFWVMGPCVILNYTKI